MLIVTFIIVLVIAAIVLTAEARLTSPLGAVFDLIMIALVAWLLYASGLLR